MQKRWVAQALAENITDKNITNFADLASSKAVTSEKQQKVVFIPWAYKLLRTDLISPSFFLSILCHIAKMEAKPSWGFCFPKEQCAFNVRELPEARHELEKNV